MVSWPFNVGLELGNFTLPTGCDRDRDSQLVQEWEYSQGRKRRGTDFANSTLSVTPGS